VLLGQERSPQPSRPKIVNQAAACRQLPSPKLKKKKETVGEVSFGSHRRHPIRRHDKSVL